MTKHPSGQSDTTLRCTCQSDPLVRGAAISRIVAAVLHIAFVIANW